MPEPITNPDLRDLPGVWFSILCRALSEHNFKRADEAMTNLDRLGVSVQFRDLASLTDRQQGGAVRA
jgi:hypothetical protein